MSNNKCGIKLPDTPIAKVVTAIAGTNVLLQNKMYTAVATATGFNPNFEKWYIKAHPGKNLSEFNIKSSGKVTKKHKDLGNDIRLYYYMIHPSVSASSRTNTVDDYVSAFGYTNASAREEGKRHVVNMLLDEFNSVQVENNNDNVDYNYYAFKANNAWLTAIRNYAVNAGILSERKAESFFDDYNEAEDRAAFISNLLSEGTGKMSDTAQNYYAVYQELFGSESTRLRYFDEIMCDTKLASLNQQINKSFEEAIAESLNDQATADDTTDNSDNDSKQELDYEADMFIVNANNHIGVYTNFMSHVGARITNYFNSLRKLQTPTREDYDTNNVYGIPETMDAKSCASMIYNNWSYNNIEEMIEGINTIGNTVAGFEAFVEFAAKLRENLDFATECFTVFARTKMNSVETRLSEGTVTTPLSNPRTSSRSALIFDLQNDIKASVMNNNPEIFASRISELQEAINSELKALKDDNDIYGVEKSDEEKQADSIKREANKHVILDELTFLIKSYYPSIQENAIKSYCYCNVDLNTNYADNNVKFLRNVNNLLTAIDSARKASLNTIKNYNDMLLRASEIKKHNAAIRKNNKHSWVDKSEYISLNDVYTDDYMSNQNESIFTIADMLLPYSVVSTDLNFRNIHGNNNSAIINSSMITKISKMLSDTKIEIVNGQITRSNPALVDWARSLYESPQYKYNTILFSQPGSLNTGMFNVTEYGIIPNWDIIKSITISLFNGSSNMDTDTNVSYTEMTNGDNIPTRYMQFFKHQDIFNKSLNVANYFLRTPSDAPKTFMIRAPRYQTDNLFKIENEDQYDKDVKRTVSEYGNALETKDVSTYLNVKALSAETPSLDNILSRANFNDGTLRNLLFDNKHTIIISNSDSILQLDTTKDDVKHMLLEYGYTEEQINTEKFAYVAYSDAPKSENTGVPIVITIGVLKKGKKGADYLSDHKYIGTFNMTLTKQDNNFVYESKPELQTDIERFLIKEIKLKAEVENGFNFNVITDIGVLPKTLNAPHRIVNTEHPMFNLIKQQFYQELIDAGNAMSHYFTMHQLKNGNWVVSYSTETPQLREGADITKGYTNYHMKGKQLYTVDANGNYTFDGNVFHSNKFTLADVKEDGSVEDVNYLDKLITTSKTADDSLINLLYGGSNNLEYISEDGETITDVKLTSAQDELVNKALSDFMSAYFRFNKDVILQYSDFIEDIPLDDQSIINMSFNYLVTMYSYDGLFEGNTKFYKDAQTILKRAKEVQGSGVPYGIVNYNNSVAIQSVEDISDIEDSKSFLNSGTYHRRTPQFDNDGNQLDDLEEDISIQDMFKGTILEGVKQRTGFTGITVKNTKKTNTPALNRLITHLVNNCGLTQEAATTLLYGPVKKKNGKIVYDKNGEPERSGGFTETKVNDAQSYITFQEWVRRIAGRGQLQRYLPLIEKLLDENSVLTTNDINEFVQVQKNFYYDMHYDPKYKLYVPRQIKNAEFVLIPRFIKGTELEAVYNLMVENGIDQLNTVETSKAANETILTLWDNNGVLTEENINDFRQNAQDNIHAFSYNHLYTQQETPQHMNEENKAGIQIMKKIIDNLPDDDSDLGKLKKLFFDLYVGNIKESSDDLLDEFEIAQDDDGNIVIDQNGRLSSINLRAFYEKLKQELMRTGIDNNLLDYVTIPENSSLPLMPAEMNSTSSKFESIVQSVFNNTITRQKLPGFHAAQITNVGFRQLGSRSEHSIFRSNDLHYHPVGEDGNPEAYVEVRLPASFLGIDKTKQHYQDLRNQIIDYLNSRVDDNGNAIPYTDEEIEAGWNQAIIAELENDKLDKFIGYRIPTEGKQSVCIMKVVDFLDDALGSTIVVPDDWVSQTGSDFDIDSVYGINFHTYTDKDGKVTKTEYKTSLTNKDWLGYLHDKFEHKRKSKKLSKEKQEVINKFNAIYDNKLRLKVVRKQEHEAYNNLSSELQDILKDFSESRKAEYDAYQTANNLDDYEMQKIKLTDIAQSIYDSYIVPYTADEVWDTLSDDEKRGVNNISKFYNSIVDLIETIDNITNESITLTDDEIVELNEIAQSARLMTLDEFTDPKNVINANTKNARSNQILQVMLDILSNPASLEENLSRSNFDDLTADKNLVMSDNVKALRNSRSAYNWIHQAYYQEDAMSGRDLKAVSVVADTLCSICNKAHAKLSIPITVLYDADRFENDDAINKALSRFDSSPRSKDDVKKHIVSISHTHYGWSNDNKNVVGKILTSYSSQTTAYILDAIKEGSIPNVNDYTFNVFKMFANMGVDYYSDLSFIMQPGITRIVDAYNSSKSVFNTVKGSNPIEVAIKELSKNLVEFDENAPVVAILSSIAVKYGDKFNKLFGLPKDTDFKLSMNINELAKLPIHVIHNIDRIKNKGIFAKASAEDKALYDLGIVLTFYRLHNMSSEIADIARCLNPDKFGAKQTVYATREVFNTINNCVYDVTPKAYNDPNKDIVSKTRKTPVLKIGDKHILEAMYPGIVNDNFTIDDMIMAASKVDAETIKNSPYPSLFAFLKYSTAASCIIAKTIFNTQDSNFIKLIEGLGQMYTGHNKKLSEEDYVDFQKYILSDIYNRCPSIKYPLTFSKTKDAVKISNIKFEEQFAETIAREEKYRIFGYGLPVTTSVPTKETVVANDGSLIEQTVYVPFEVEDVTNPQPDEIKTFNTFSPAQKVKWIQTHFEDSGVFAYLDANLYNSGLRYKYRGMHTLEYNDQHVEANVIYAEFKKAFYNKNPLIVSAACDVIKYAVQVEGLRMSAKAVNKIIDNDCLRFALGTDGIGLVDFINQSIYDIKNHKHEYSDEDFIEALYENYLRSHPNNKGIKTIYLSNKNEDKYKLEAFSEGLYRISMQNIDNDENKSKIEFNDRCKSAGLRTVFDDKIKYVPNSYVRIKLPSYRTESHKDTTILYKIYDLGDEIILAPRPQLTANENSTWSIREEYNEGIMDPIISDRFINRYKIDKQQNAANYTTLIENINDYKNANNSIWYESRKIKAVDVPAREFNANESSDWSGVVASTIDHFDKKLKTEDLYINVPNVKNYIFSPGPDFGSLQTIKNVLYNVYLPTDIVSIEKTFLYQRTDANGNPYYADVSKIENESLRNIIEIARKSGSVKLLHTVCISKVPVNNDVMASSFTDIEEDFIEYAESKKSNANDDTSKDFVKALAMRNIKSYNADIIDKNKNYLGPITAKYAENEADRIVKSFNMFVRNPKNSNEYLSITDERVLDLCMNDANINYLFLSALNRAMGFLTKFDNIIGMNVESEDKDYAVYIDRIKKAISRVIELPVKSLQKNYALKLVKDKSTNPLVKDGMIDAMEGFWKTDELMWRFHDLTENGTPILQVILKDVQSDIEAKIKTYETKIKPEFNAKVEEIFKKAEEAGVSIDWNNIIDEQGDFVKAYGDEFYQYYTHLLEEITEIIANTHYGSIEHLKKQLELDALQAEYINQPAVQEYYRQKVLLQKFLLEKYPESYSKYVSNVELRNNIFRNKQDDEPLSKEEEDLLDKINKNLIQIRYLLTDEAVEYMQRYNVASKSVTGSDIPTETIIDEETGESKTLYVLTYKTDKYDKNTGDALTETIKVEWNPADYQDSEKQEAILNNLDEHNTFGQYIDALDNLDDKYFEYEATPGFEETLNKYLDTIRRLEKRDHNNITTVDYDVLNSIPEYKEAKTWLRRNAQFKADYRFDKDGNPTKLGEEIVKALRYFSVNTKGKRKGVKRIMDRYNAYDEYGQYDGRVLLSQTVTDETTGETRNIGSEIIADIKAEMIRNYYSLKATTNSTVYEATDRILISNAKPNENEYYTSELYGKELKSSELNLEYVETVTELNEHLMKYYDNNTKTIDFGRIEDTPEGIKELKLIAYLYQKLDNISKYNDDSEFDENNEHSYEYATNMTLFNQQVANLNAVQHSKEYYDAMQHVLLQHDKDGNFKYVYGSYVPNRFLYSYIKPVGKPGDPEYDKYVDKARTKYMNIVQNAWLKHDSIYFEAEKNIRQQTMSNADYIQWLRDNSVYNPYTRKVEPLECWRNTELNTDFISDNGIKTDWVPKFNQRTKKPKPEYVNPNYDETKNKLGNYITGINGGKYDSTKQMNQYEAELKEYISSVLYETANVNSAKRYFDEGHLPAQAKTPNATVLSVGKELLKVVGLNLSVHNGNERWDKEISYETDYASQMPMLKALTNDFIIEKYKELKPKQDEYYNLNPPVQTAFASDSEYLEAKEKYYDRRNKLKQEIDAINNEIREERKKLIDTDWMKVINNYLTKAAYYNAVNDSKQKLFFLQYFLKDFKHYSRKYGIYGDLEKHGYDDEDTDDYVKTVDNNLIKQYNVFLRRLLHNQWKEKNGIFTAIANNLQGFASANYMMLNFRGGISNVLLGEMGILSEAAAGEYFNASEWKEGTAEWISSALAFGRSAYDMTFHNKHTCYTKQKAIIDYFNILDYDQLNGIDADVSLETYAKHLRDLMFSPQSIGEHFMQNSVLFAMLKSHKLAKDTDGTYAIMSKREYIDLQLSKNLHNILTKEQYKEFVKFKNGLKQDKNVLKDYAWFRKDALTDFIFLHCTKPQIEEFVKLRNEKEEEYGKEFDAKVNLYDQLELGENGKLHFVDGSELSELDKINANISGKFVGKKDSVFANNTVSISYQLLGKFTNKVRHVNNKIHGVYNRIGSAYIESKWWGALVMQYHKHLPMGLIKRWLARGNWDEYRNSVTKGIAESIADLVSLDIRRMKVEHNLTNDQVNALATFIFTIQNIGEFISNFKLALSVLPNYEKANLKRNIGDFAGTTSALAFTAALWGFAGDDEEIQDNVAFATCLYIGDKLASESFMYNPIGLFNEAKKLMSTPIAAQSIVSDMGSSLMAIFNALTDENYNPYYQSGRFAGEHKLSVYFQRRIPMWSALRNMWDGAAANHYYKVGQNPIGMLNIKELMIN